MRPTLEIGAPIELRIEKPVYRGLGLARHEGCVVFVPGTYQGERVLARVRELGKGHARAELEQLLEASPARRKPPCRHADRCGGCAYQPLEYAEQLRVKEAVLRESLARAGVTFDGALSFMPSPERGWRLRAELHAAWGSDGARLGFHEPGSHAVVEVLECQQLSLAMNAAVRSLQTALSTRRPLTEAVRSVELCESLDGSRRVACLVAELDAGRLPGLAVIADLVPGLTGLLARPLRSLGREAALTLWGDPFVSSSVLELSLRAHQQSFFQANRHLIEPLVRSVLGSVPAGSPVLDLYAGVGLFALPLAARGDDVVALEINPLAVLDARLNASAAGLFGVRFETGDVESLLRRERERPEERVVLDPPRSGASRGALRAVAERHPASITYVSCDPPTLGRDLGLLGQLGYRLAALEAFDMFPDTFHVEAVALLLPAAVL